jgi:hypothetical protein
MGVAIGGTLAGSMGAKGSESISLKSSTACVVVDIGNKIGNSDFTFSKGDM